MEEMKPDDKEDKKPAEKVQMKQPDMCPHGEKVGTECSKCPDGKATASKEGMYGQKGELGGESPQEGAQSGTDAGSSTSPGMGVPSTQQVLSNNSGIGGARNASSGSSAGQSPADVHYSGKEAGVEPELMKSPLFVELSKAIDGMQKALNKKVEALEKSVADRLGNIQKSMEKFYSQPFYKAIDDSIGAEGVHKMSIKDQIEKGTIPRR